MRILLFTGKGGVGKTTIAAATALRASATGLRTLVVSTDPAHSLADALDVSLGDALIEISLPKSLGPGTAVLAGQQLDARLRLEETWGEMRDYLVAVLNWAGVDAVEAEELATLPGLEEIFALADLKAHAESGEWDLIVVDCAPTAETLRLLSLPDVLSWYMDKIFTAQRTTTKVVRPLLSRTINIPIPDDRVFGSIRRFYDRLDGVRELLTDGEVTSARIVMNAERIVIAEARRMHAYLSLFGYHVDAVLVNRLLPDEIKDPWFKPRIEAEAEHLATIMEAFAPTPVLTVELAPEEPVGIDLLLALGDALYGDVNPAERLSTEPPFTIESHGDVLVLALRLPGATREDVDLVRVGGGELVVTVGPYRRAISLPDSLVRREVGVARVSDDRLEIEFVER